MEIFKLFGTVGLNDAEAQQGLDNVDQKAQNTERTFGDMIGTAGKWGAALAAAATVAAGAVSGLMVKYGNFADELLDQSEIIGVSTDELQRWRDVAIDAGVDTDIVATSLERFNKQLERGNELSPRLKEAFDTMNMGVEEFQALHPDEQMREIVQTMMDLEGADRRAFANQMNMAEMLPLIAEMEAKGDSVSEIMEAIEPAFSEEDLGQMNEVRTVWDNIKQSIFELIGEALMPLFNWFDDNLEQIEEIVEGVFTAITNTISWFIDTIGNVMEVIEEWRSGNEEQITQLKLSFLAFFTAVGEFLKVFIDGFIELWDAYGEDIMRIASAALSFISTIFKTTLDTITNIFNIFTALLTGDWEAFWVHLERFADDLLEGIKNIVSGGLDLVLSVFDTSIEDIKAGWTAFWENLEEKVSTGIDNIVGWFTELPGRVMEKVTELRDDVVGVFGNLFDTLVGNSIVPDMMEGIEGITEAGMDNAAVIIEKGTEAWEKLFGDGAKKSVDAVGKEMERLSNVMKGPFADPMPSTSGSPQDRTFGDYIGHMGGTEGAASRDEFSDALDRAARDIAEEEGETISVGRSMAEQRISEGQTQIIQNNTFTNTEPEKPSESIKKTRRELEDYGAEM